MCIYIYAYPTHQGLPFFLLHWLFHCEVNHLLSAICKNNKKKTQSFWETYFGMGEGEKALQCIGCFLVFCFALFLQIADSRWLTSQWNSQCHRKKARPWWGGEHLQYVYIYIHIYIYTYIHIYIYIYIYIYTYTYREREIEMNIPLLCPPLVQHLGSPNRWAIGLALPPAQNVQISLGDGGLQSVPTADQRLHMKHTNTAREKKSTLW